MNAPTAHELVARGAALLDEKLPGWADQIDLSSLTMSDSCNCVLGQLAGNQVNLDQLSWHGESRVPYVRMASALFDTHERAVVAGQSTSLERAHGFYVSTEQRQSGGPDYFDLDVAWRRELLARRTLDAR